MCVSCCVWICFVELFELQCYYRVSIVLKCLFFFFMHSCSFHSPIRFGHAVCILRSCARSSLVSVTASSTHAYARNHPTNDLQVFQLLHASQQYALLGAYYKNDSTAAFAIMKLYQFVFLLPALHSCSYLTPWYITAVAVLWVRILVCWISWPWVPASSSGQHCCVLSRIHLCW